MRNYPVDKEKIKISNILYCVTSKIDYCMHRTLIIELPELKMDEILVVEGYHCSCYDFDDCEWEGTVYTVDEYKKLLQKGKYINFRRKLLKFINYYFYTDGDRFEEE